MLRTVFHNFQLLKIVIIDDIHQKYRLSYTILPITAKPGDPSDKFINIDDNFKVIYFLYLHFRALKMFFFTVFRTITACFLNFSYFSLFKTSETQKVCNIDQKYRLV